MYADLKKIYDRTRLDYFAMAVSYLVDIGWRNAKEIDESDIHDAQGNGLMTKEFVQWVMRTARDIANATNGPTEIIQFCDVEGVFEVEKYSNGERLGRQALEELSKKLAEFTLYDDTISFTIGTDEERKELLENYLGIEADDLEIILKE